MATPTTLPASFTAGAVLTAAQMNALRGAFRILQVVSAETSTNANTTSSTLTTTGLSASITPSSTSSKILVFATISGCRVAATLTGIELALFRGATNVQTFSKFACYTTSSTDTNQSVSGMRLDSPNTTSATTYEVRFAKNASGSGTVEVQQGNLTTSTIILCEVSA
jgi:hypothetical protein